MKRFKNFIAALMVGTMSLSAVSSAVASDIIVMQDTDIEVFQGNDGKEKDAITEETLKSEDADNETSEYEYEEETPQTDEYEEADVEEADVEEADNDKVSEVVDENDVPYEDEDVMETENDTNAPSEENGDAAETEECAEAESSNDGSEVNVNINNTNYLEINDNKGTIYINIYNGIGVEIDSNKDGDTDVNVDTASEIAVSGDENVGSEETTESVALEEETEETTEKVAEKGRSRRNSSSGSSSGSGRSSSKASSGSKNAEVSSKTKNEDVYEAKPESTTTAKYEYPEKEKKVVCMTIGSNLMNVNGDVAETDSAPYISEGYTLVPLRCISTVFDADVEWEQATKTAIIKADGIETRFTVNSDTMFVNGRYVDIPKAAEIQNGRTYVPLRALGEALGANVSWIPDSKSVLIIK